MSATSARSPRASMTAIPWSASVPDTSTTSPGSTRAASSTRPSGTIPMPAVVTYTPSAAPWPTTLVSPVTMATPAAEAARAMSSTSSRSSAIGKPSSSTNAAASPSGRAPITARSFTVPFTARSPTDPPGNRRGCTTNESVVMASAFTAGQTEATAASVCAASGPLPNAGRNTDSSSAADDLPPAPCARVTTSSCSRGVRRPKAATRSTTASSAAAGSVVRPFGRAGHGRASAASSARTRLDEVGEERGLRFLDAVDALGSHDEAVVDVVAVRHRAAVVPGESDREHARERGRPRRRGARCATHRWWSSRARGLRHAPMASSERANTRSNPTSFPRR